MTTSGLYTFNPNTAAIIARALRQCGAIEQGETAAAADAQDAQDALNAMTKAWQAEGINVWAETTATIFLQPGQKTYYMGGTTTDAVAQSYQATTLATNALSGATSVVVASAAGMSAGDQFGVQVNSGVNFWTTIAAPPSGSTVTLAAPLPAAATSGALAFSYTNTLVRPLRAPFARRYTLASQISNPLIVMSRLDYQALSSQQNTGTPTQFFFDPQLVLAQFTVWPAPADNTNAAIVTVQLPLQDFSTMANTPDFPQEWANALTWNLAVELAPEYDVPAERFQMLVLKAKQQKDIVSAWNKEPEPLLFGVAFEPGYR